MEVTLKTEVEAGASGFSVKGGGNEGIFIKKVLKESPASKIFSLREGDQLLSATVFFDNIKYEDALKILQYSEPYRVQFSLKRKIAVQEDLEHSSAQHKKERIGQEKELSESIPEETLHVSGKAISEEDRETLIGSQRVGRSKRPKKDRLSWPKFQSIKNKKILRHRRSHSTSDAYEPAMQDISPTSTDTESQFPQEVHTKEKKGSQRKLKFPNIGFRMHRSKAEPQEKQKKEIKTMLISEKEKIHKDDISLENPEILTVEYTTSAYEMKTGEVHETLTKDLKDMKNGIPSHVKQCPEVEINIKEKDKEATSKFSVPEVPDITTEIPKPSLETGDLKVSPTKKSPQASSKSRKKKQKGTRDKKEGESGIDIDLMGHTAKGSVQVKGLEIGTAKAELQTSETQEMEGKRAEDTQIINIQKINYGVSMPTRKETETDTTKQGSEDPQTVDLTSEDSRNFGGKTHLPDAELEVSTWKIQMPSFKMGKTLETDTKIKREGSREDTDDSMKKEHIEVDEMLTDEKGLNVEIDMKRGEKDMEGKESKFRLPKLKFPTFTWSTTKEETGQTEAQISEREEKVQIREEAGGLEVCAKAEEIKDPSAEIEIEISKEKLKENDIKQKAKIELQSPKKITIEPASMEINIEERQKKSLISKIDVEAESTEFSQKSKEKQKISVTTDFENKAPKVDISLPSVDITLPQASVDLQAPEAALGVEGEIKGPEKEAAKTKDGKFKMPKFGMPSFGWSSSREAKGSVAAEVDVSLKEPQVTVPSAATEVDVTLADPEIEVPTLDVSLDSSCAKEGEMVKSRTSVFKMPKISLSKSFKPHEQIQSGVDVSVSETICYSLTEETPSVPSESVGTKPLPDIKGDSVSKSSKFRIPSIGFSKAEAASSKIDLEPSLQKGDITLTKYQINLTESQSKIASVADENLSDFEILGEDGSEEQGVVKLDAQTTSGEISLVDTEVTVKFPKFRTPKFRIRSKGKASESDLGSSEESEISRGRITSDMTDPDIEKPAQISDAQLGVKLQKPSLEVALGAPTLDPNLGPVDVTLPKLEAEIHGPDLECKTEQEVVSGEKGTEEKENKFKSSKFKLPSFRWSPKKEAIAPSHIEGHLEGPALSGDMGSELTFSSPENQHLQVEFDTTEKDGEKVKNKKSQFTMPKISFPKIKGQKVQVSLPVLETDVSGPKQEKEGVSEQKSEQATSGEGAGLDIKVPEVTVPTLEFSKPEAKAPKIEMDVPTGEAILLTCEEGELILKSGAANAGLSTSDVKLTTEGSLEVKSPDISVERASSEVVVGDVEIKIEGTEGKGKRSKFQMPKVGIALSKGKGSEKDVSQSKSEVKVPQLKTTVEISDIAVEGPNLEVECGAGPEICSPEVKMIKTDSKASEVDVHLPSADISIPKTVSDIQDSDATVKIKGEIKQDGNGEEKEGHFKMPKFKLPSFSWSPKKEASVKSDSGANLEEQNLAVTSSRIDTEVKGTATDEQGSGPDLDLEISAGKVEQKSPIKKPQFVMPKISLSKIKVPKSHSHSPKVEADATLLKTDIEGDDSIKIPDIEKRHSEGTEEGAQISIKLADTKGHTLEFSRIETEASKTEMSVSSAKIDASLTPSEGSFQQVDFKVSSTNECNIQKTGIKLPKGETSVDLKSPDILTESSSVVDGRKMKLEGPEGKVKMPRFQKPKFGISLTKGKGPETEISSPKIEAELPQLKMTDEIADIAVGVPASELASDVSDPGVVDSKIKTPQALIGGIEVAKVDISTHSVSKPKTEGVTKSLEEKEIKLKEHEIKAEEVQTEEYQGWFKMPKFRIPGFSKSSIKEKKSDAGIERRTEEAQATIPAAKVQTETSIPENTFSLPHAVAEITIGKEGIQKLGDSVKSSDVSLPKIEGDISLSTESSDSRVNIPKTETYADVVKRSAEGHTSEITMSAAELSKSYPSASESDKDNISTKQFPTCTLTFPEHEVKSQDTEVPKAESSMKLETSGVRCKPSSAEITLDATQKKIDVSLPNEELDIQNKETAIKKGKIKGDVKFMGKDSEESQFKRTTCEWSTSEGSEDGTYVTARLEDLKVEVPTVKTDVKITRIDPEMKFQVKSIEKDVSAGVEVQVEDRAETSKVKAYKFKIPKFGMLHSEIKGFEDNTDLPKSEADSASKSEKGTAEMQLQETEGSIGLRSPALDHMEASARITGGTVDITQGVPEVSVKIPKLKIPRFTFRTLPIEADVLLSKVVTDPKGSSTDMEVVQLQSSSSSPEETSGALEGDIQKAKSKILTLTEPDVKTAQMTATIQSSLSSAGQDIHWSYTEGQEVSEKVEPEHVAIERCEIYTTEIVKESEILSSEVKTATLGFSLLKAKLPESRSDLEVLIHQPSATGGASARKPRGAGESFGTAAQRTGSAELKPSDKLHHESEESREVSLTKFKTSAAEVKYSSKLEERITAGPLSKDGDVVEVVDGEEKDVTTEKEKTDSKRSPGRFKFWLPSVGFSSSGDETSTDTKPEIKKSVPEDVKPADISDDSSQQSEKTGWFRFPKLGFTSPSKKAKSVDKEEVGHKEGRLSDEDSPTDKLDVFFDAQESLSPKEITEGEKAEIDGASSIVTSSARTELILLEEGKDSKSNIVGDTTK